MPAGSDEQPADFVQDVGIDTATALPTRSSTAAGGANWRALLVVGLAIIALLGVYALGRSAAPAPQAAPLLPVPTTPPTVVPPATATPEPTPPAELVDLLGQGSVLAQLDLGNRSTAIIWCRGSVPGTRIPSTLALIHVTTSLQFGDQVVLYEELTKPRVPSGSGRTGSVLSTEGLGVGSFAAPDVVNDAGDEAVDGDAAAVADGTPCATCAPEQVTLGASEVLVGSCVHSASVRGGIVYVIAPPVRPGQTPLALHIGCGVTTARVEGDRLVVEAEAPLTRGLHGARFPLPSISFERIDGRFVASDLELLDYLCNVDRSSQLADGHILRTDPVPSISFDRIDSAIGVIGMHSPMLFGLTSEQCSMFTRAWWAQPDLEDPTGSPIADLVGIEPPAGERDWFYGCQRS